jgi:hypothetical protein
MFPEACFELHWPLHWLINRNPLPFCLSAFVVCRSREGTGHPPRAIEALSPGDAIEGGVVVAVMTLALKESESRLISYASGAPNITEFAVVLDRDDAVWRHVGDSPLSIRSSVAATTAPGGAPLARTARRVYQLITSSHLLVVDGTVFADYDGVEDSVAIRSGYAVNLASLNKKRALL